MKVLTTDLEKGMKITINLFDYSGNPIYVNKTNRFSGETTSITKNSPSFTVKSITEMKTTYSISRVKRTPTRTFAIEVEEMNDRIELSSKQKVTIA